MIIFSTVNGRAKFAYCMIVCDCITVLFSHLVIVKQLTGYKYNSPPFLEEKTSITCPEYEKSFVTKIGLSTMMYVSVSINIGSQFSI